MDRRIVTPANGTLLLVLFVAAGLAFGQATVPSALQTCPACQTAIPGANGPSPYGPSPSGMWPTGGSPYGGSPYGTSPYGTSPYGSSSYPTSPFATSPGYGFPGSFTGYNSRPTPEQTRAFLNSIPQFRALDEVYKTNLINGAPGAWLFMSTLPNGAQNPLYNSPAGVAPNWYVPATWPSNWVGWQQPNGVPSTVYSPISPPTAFPGSSYNPVANYAPTINNISPPLYQQKNSSQPSLPAQTTPPSMRTNTFPSASTLSNQLPAQTGPRLADIQSAQESRQRALDLSEASGDKIGQAINHAALAEVLVYKGDAEEAFKHLNLAEPLILESKDLKQQADFFRVKGAAYLSSGAFDQATATYQRALPILRSLDDRTGEAEITASLGWAYQSLGDVQSALKDYEDAITLFLKLENKGGEARTRLALGVLYQSLGEEEKATQQYQSLYPIASDIQKAAVFSSIGQHWESHNNFREALRRYDRAIALARSTGDHATEAAVLAGMGRCYMGLGNFEKATALFVQAGRLMSETGNREGEAGITASLGEIAYRSGTVAIARSLSPKVFFETALKNYNQALSMMRATRSRTGEIGVLTNIGLLYDAWNQPKQALTYYTQALQELDDLLAYARIEEFRIDLSSQSANLYRRAILLEISQNRIKEAFDLSERARARAFLDQLGNNRIDIHGHMPLDFSFQEGELRQKNLFLERQIGQELAKPLGDVNRETISSLQLRLSLVRKEYEDLLVRLKVSNPEYASLLTVSPLTHSEAQQLLDPNTTLVSYFTGPEITLAFVVTRESIRCVKLHVTEAELAGALSTFLDFSGENNVSPSLKQLYRWLIAPIKSELKTSLVGIVPHGALHNLPFASLSPDGKQYFGDDHEIFLLPSVSALPLVRARAKPATGTGRILVVANDGEDRLAHLSHAYGEARAVASLFDAQPLLGKAATASEVRANAGHYDILHLIGHIEPNSQTPGFASIMLAPGKTDDGPLDVNQVYALDLRDTNLVVLSGCQSQLGRKSRGDDIVGFNRAFMYAGASSVIASLWSVDDEATQQLMTAFYQYLKQGLNKAASLQAAQRDMRLKYSNPYYWAAFVLTGDPGTRDSSTIAANRGKL